MLSAKTYSEVSGNIHHQEVPLSSLSICWNVPLSKKPCFCRMVSKSSLIPLLSVCLLSSKTVVHQAASAEVCKAIVVAIHLKEIYIHWEWNESTSSSCWGPIFINIAPVALHPTDNAIFTSELICCIENFMWVRIKVVLGGKTVRISWPLSSSLRKGQSGGAASVPPECHYGALTWGQKWGCSSFQICVPWPCLGQQTWLTFV